MSLVSTIESLQGKPLTPEEVATLGKFQKHFDIDDDDPLMVVMALMARSQLILESAPAVLQQKVNETIELHRGALRDQAVLVAKDLINVIVTQIQAADANWKVRWGKYALSFGCGVVLTCAMLSIAKYLTH